MEFDSFNETPLEDAFYFLTLIDDSSRKIWGFTLTFKSEAKAKSEEFLEFIKGRSYAWSGS